MSPQGIVSAILPVHILAGALALVFGYVALFAVKGATLHRRSGLFFVYAMVALGLTGALTAALRDSQVSVVAGLLTVYFVTTALLTVRPRTEGSRGIDIALALGAVLVSVLAFKTGSDSAKTGRPESAPMFIFGVVGLLAVAGDSRVIRGSALQGPRRIARHLWRMCFAMWVAAASFFWGPRGRVPEAIRIPPLLAVAVLTPVAVMLYWLWRVRIRQSLRGLVQAAPIATPDAPHRT